MLPIGGPIVTPRFAATRTDAYASSCCSGGTRSATIACPAEPPNEPSPAAPTIRARPNQTWWPTPRKSNT